MAERIHTVGGRACVLRGNDIDTDRIIPARFLRCVTFDGLGEHAFADDRKLADGAHPLDQAHYQGAKILLVGANFGCGSSREHAPQSLMRAGFNAFVGESFGEIFAGNCTALGLPCATLPADELARLMQAVEAAPEQELTLSLETCTLTSNAGAVQVEMREGARKALIEGGWNATAVLGEAGDAIEQTAAALPYLNDYAEAS